MMFRMQHTTKQRKIELRVPEEWRCKISRKLMHDPVVAADGFTYERAQIEQHLMQFDRSPVTREVLPHKRLIPNHVINFVVNSYLAKSKG